jgi:alkylation response protein AidB-like acyl-CoA dehydrogenase
MTEKIDTILAAARRHCQDVIRPEVNAWNAAGTWPRHASDEAAARGLTGLYCPMEWGGQGLSLGDGIRVYEELGAGDAAYAFALSMHNICAYAVCSFGTAAFKDQWARDLTAGRKLANFSLTEPRSGSDAAHMSTHARINGDGTWTISGAKAWVSLAGEADVYLTVVKTAAAPGYKDMAMIAIPKGTEGLRFGPRYDTPSYTFLPLSEMYLNEVTVPAENIILPVGQGLQGALMAIDIARVSIAAGCCGLMQAALDTALSYAKNREMFGGVALDLDGIQWMLGEVATDLEASRLLYRAAARALGTPAGPVMAAHAKRFVPDAALKAATTCTQVLGGMGLLTPYGLDRLSRLAQMLRIVDGTTEVARVVIGRTLQKRAADLPDVPVPTGVGGASETGEALLPGARHASGHGESDPSL